MHLKVEDVLTRQLPLEKAAQAFLRITEGLIKQKKSKGVSPYLDIVREVINYLPVHWLSNNIVRYLVSCLQIPFAHTA